MSNADENVWAESAVPATFHPPLAESIRTDVAVIGAGYCGLSAALHLAEAGVQAVVVDAHQPGWGASGRNGGQVIPGFKYDPDELEAMFGSERGGRIWRFGAGTADCVFDLIARHRMDVTTRRAGWVQGIHSEKAAVRGRRRAEQWQRRGADVEYLDAAATAEILGTELYRGSVIDRRGGALHPLSYVRELARVAGLCGARIFGETIAARLERRETGWQIHCHNGASVQADRVLICTNAYSDTLVPGLSNSIIAANSLQVATEPLPDEWRARIMPRGEVLSDTRKVIRYWRLDDRGRLLMGGRGPYREPDGEADWATSRRGYRSDLSHAGAAAMHAPLGRTRRHPHRFHAAPA